MDDSSSAAPKEGPEYHAEGIEPEPYRAKIEGAGNEGDGDLSSKIGDIKDKAAGIGKMAGERLDQTTAQIRDFAGQQPLSSLLLAGGIGIAIGLFLNRQRDRR